MGLRSWITPIKSYEEFKELNQGIEDNDLADYICYALVIEKKGTPFKIGDCLIGWVGDTNSSLTELEPKKFIKRTKFLDHIIAILPTWNDDPGLYGKWLTAETIEDYFKGEGLNK